MVTGHLFSTQTEVALPNYLKANPPIPVILATETNPNLLPPKANESTYYPVFQLAPTDDLQAQTAARFAVEQGAETVWIVEDTILNRTYSHYLATQFIDQFQKQTKSGKLMLLSWTENLTPSVIKDAKELKVDWIFFAGHWSNALIFLQQVRAIWTRNGIHGTLSPEIILSDWCANEQLLMQGQENVENVYITHPLTADDFAQDKGDGYWGEAARVLVGDLISKADRRFTELGKNKGGWRYWWNWALGIHDAADARKAIISIMEESVLQRRDFDIFANTRVRFSPNGTIDRSDAQFHVWKVKNGEFKDLWPTSDNTRLEEEQESVGGKHLFARLCSECHGMNDHSKHEKSAPNLTQLSKNNAGIFPFWHVADVIDGRAIVERHNSRMPVWGKELQVGEDEEKPREQILRLVRYIRSIQKN